MILQLRGWGKLLRHNWSWVTCFTLLEFDYQSAKPLVVSCVFGKIQLSRSRLVERGACCGVHCGVECVGYMSSKIEAFGCVFGFRC